VTRGRRAVASGVRAVTRGIRAVTKRRKRNESVRGQGVRVLDVTVL
jgi:hypothetical protein